MTHLRIRLLGSIQVDLNGESVSSLRTSKVQGLLSYLAVEEDRPHRRETLAGIFWPQKSEQRSRANLSQALFTLRSAFDESHADTPFFHITRESIQFNCDSDYWLDVAVFEAAMKAQYDRPIKDWAIERLEEATALYQGDFLEGFSIADSPAFEEWSLLQRERLHRLIIEALDRMISFYEKRSAYETALQHAWRQVALEPWREEAHTAVMRLLAVCGRRSEALAQYETCRRILAEELNVAPLQTTTMMYENIRDGRLDEKIIGWKRPAEVDLTLPPFLSIEPLHTKISTTFVERDKELTKLGQRLELAIAGQGQVVFVTGEAGSGKTALIQEFARRAQGQYSSLVVATSKGTAYTGVGDPYAIFRQILAMLTGDVEERWNAGAINREEVMRIYGLLPFAIQALVEVAPNLVNTFVAGTPLLERSSAYVQNYNPEGVQPAWLIDLEELAASQATSTGVFGPHQSAFFEQYGRFLGVLASRTPLLLVLDDLQWADASSTSLFFHLSRNLTGSRILFVGAYRAEEIKTDLSGKRHPLEPVLNELQRDFGDIFIPMGLTPDRSFVEAFVDSEPNRLSEAFRETLFHMTKGHPLFTIELLRGLQERGDLIQDDLGHWQEGPCLDWETLPPRVEGVIAERIGRLPEAPQRMLQAASVQGESFAAEVVARVQKMDSQQIVAQFSGVVSKEHRLVRAQSIKRLEPEGQLLSCYQFHHVLFQKYLYNSLDKVEQAHLHAATGTALEALYQAQTTEVAVQLARHFETAGNFDKAVAYRLEAGNYALHMSANEDAVGHLTRGLELLSTFPETPRRRQQELSLQLSLGAALQATRGYTAPQVRRAYTRARELCKQGGEAQQLLPAIMPLATYSLMRLELQQAIALGKQMLAEAKRAEDALLIALAHLTLGYILFHTGRFRSSSEHLNRMIAFYDREQHKSMAYIIGHDLGVASILWDAWPLWFLGFPDQALQRSRESIDLALALKHALSLTVACGMAAVCHVYRREPEAAQDLGERTMQLVKEHGTVFYHPTANFAIGWALAAQGQIEDGLARMHDCLATWQAMGVHLYRKTVLIFIAEVHARANQIEQGLQVLDEAEKTVSPHSERYYEAELHRIQGELLYKAGHNPSEVEGCYHQAIIVARRQMAKSLELRAMISLSRLWRDQGRRQEAKERLAEVYAWFTEGFDTADLQEAARLLDELA
jgi:DNA-binding SARP family transcriptional activator/predicted ATPase